VNTASLVDSGCLDGTASFERSGDGSGYSRINNDQSHQIGQMR